jgi:hypothetical protein
MAETIKKAKAPSKTAKTATPKSAAPKVEAAKVEAKAEPKKVATTAPVEPIALVAAAKVHAPAPAQISHEEVARVAHRFWAERGHRHGSHIEDWFRAEQELRSKAS